MWSFESPKEQHFTTSGQSREFIPKMSLLFEREWPNSFDLRSLEPGITLVENLAVSGSSYFLDDLRNPDLPDFDNVTLTEYHADDIYLHYTGNKAGWVVLPIRADSNWRGTIDGENVSVERFLDLFPALQVSGSAHIRLYYDDAGVLRSFVRLPLIGLCVLLAVLFIGRRLEQKVTS
ncbi:hypothetical protein GCM10010136_12840 [Limoniibacter endophyticus]|uniref:Uncharacterized protein n=1 Tax=Limoniibacter endophyticus TaxID=1565040 RepID=A0A8J3DHG7_9HYPH|nr:hypothetical protein GCM10010136_12840 [Limoniibacter endophyticus]